MKTCRTCGTEKPLDAFYKRKTGTALLDCITCYRLADNARQPAYYQKNRSRLVEKSRANRAELRALVLAGYGGRCTCCGEDTVEFLALDHVHGGGNAHRKQVGTSQAVYRSALKEGFPPKYRLLCHNCNVARGLYGTCPHEVGGRG